MRLLKKIRTASVKVGVSKSQTGWYRGHSNSMWTLTPRLLRAGHGHDFVYRAENASYADFRSSAHKYVHADHMRDSWDYLAAMQHFGIATRLLDWTTELDIAIYFAIASLKKIDQTRPDTWPCIWVLNPYSLNRMYDDKNVIFDRADSIPYDYYDQTIACIKENKSWPHEAPVAYNPGFTNQRIEAQHGRFTVHGANFEPLGSETNPPQGFWGLAKVTIDPNDWGELKGNSIRDPATHLRIYPDIEGYAKLLNHRMRL